MKRFVGKTSKPFALLATILLVAAIGTGSTLAWLMTSPPQVANSFVVPVVTPTIHEDFSGTTKSNVYVVNDVSAEQGIDVYIRVALVPTWETTEGAVAPISASLNDLTMTDFPGGNWVRYPADGNYYYYTGKVAPGGKTSMLIGTATVKSGTAGATAGYRMNLQVLAEAIQATKSAVTDAWPAGAWEQMNK